MTKINQHLDPSQCCDTAGLIYGLESATDVARNFRGSIIERSFNFASNMDRFEGRSGAFGFKTSTGFGVMAMGKKGTPFERHALLACRGTASGKDALTDLNAGIQMSLSGYKVHSGFNRTFRDFESNIGQFISKHQPAAVHCVGHSLGGALANLCADSIITKSSSPQVALYTFGAPRVGDMGFASNLSLSSKIGVDNIHRVYHGGDPVAMVPFWPFVHAPQPGGECYIGTMLSFNPLQHLMKNYTSSVKGKTWTELRCPHPSITNHAEKWISEPLAYGGLNAYNIMMLGKAFQIAIKKTLSMGWNGAGLAVVAGASFLDHLSYLLDSTAQTSEENSTLVSAILRRALRMCGIKVKDNVSITKQFIRYVLTNLSLALGRVIDVALAASRTLGI